MMSKTTKPERVSLTFIVNPTALPNSHLENIRWVWPLMTPRTWKRHGFASSNTNHLRASYKPYRKHISCVFMGTCVCSHCPAGPFL